MPSTNAVPAPGPGRATDTDPIGEAKPYKLFQLIERDGAYGAPPVPDVSIELLGQPETSIRGACGLFLHSQSGGNDVVMPMAHDLRIARGLPVYFLLIDVGGPIITIS